MGKGRKSKARLKISLLEADVAYFDARLALLDRRPVSRYQEAQIKAYRELERLLSEQLRELRGEPESGATGDGLEVEVIEPPRR